MHIYSSFCISIPLCVRIFRRLVDNPVTWVRVNQWSGHYNWLVAININQSYNELFDVLPYLKLAKVLCNKHTSHFICVFLSSSCCLAAGTCLISWIYFCLRLNVCLCISALKLFITTHMKWSSINQLNKCDCLCENPPC